MPNLVFGQSFGLANVAHVIIFALDLIYNARVVFYAGIQFCVSQGVYIFEMNLLRNFKIVFPDSPVIYGIVLYSLSG